MNVTAIRGPRTALSLRGDLSGGSDSPPVRQTNDMIETMKKIIDQDIHTAGIANSTHTFHHTKVFVFCASSAQMEARYMLLIVPNRTIKIHPYERLMIAQTNESKAAVLVIGSVAASFI